MKRTINKNPGCTIMGMLLLGSIQAPDSNIGFAFMFAMAIVLLSLVIWEGIK